MKRRSFIGGLAALLAAKPKISPESLTGTNLYGIGHFAMPTTRLSGDPSSLEGGGGGARSWAQTGLLRLRALKALSPAWFEERRRMDARHVAFIDPDIASHHSWSLSAKIAAQRERNYHRSIEMEERDLANRVAQEMFKI